MQTQRISGATGLVGLLGFPVAHSISPLLHNHLMRHYGLDLAYVPLPVAPRDLHGALHTIRSCGFAGANVTIPHKRQVMHYCDSISELSRRVGAVNTLVCRDGFLHGDTTDAAGFYRALAWMGHNPRGGSCLLLGTGGAARSLAFSMALDDVPGSLTIAGRNREKARALAEEISRECGRQVYAVGLDDPAMDEICLRATLCVNCTSAGMHPKTTLTPLDRRCLHPGMTVFDTVYNPLRTRLITEAAEAGCAVQNGLRMLVYQGLASFELWTGVAVDESVIDFEELAGAVAAH